MTALADGAAYCLDDETTWVSWGWVTELRSGSGHSWRLDLLAASPARVAEAGREILSRRDIDVVLELLRLRDATGDA